MNSTANIFSRQTGLVNQDRILSGDVDIVGAGTIGSWSALCLAKLGIKSITLNDHDTLRLHNVPNQFYPISVSNSDKKTTQLSEQLYAYATNQAFTVSEIDEKFGTTMLTSRVLISAVDNMKARYEIFDHFQKQELTDIMIDGRMAGNILEVYSVTKDRLEQYRETLFDDQQATPVPCSMRSVGYNGMVIGGLISSLVAKHFSGETLPFAVFMDLKNYLLELQTGGGEHDA